ncbi:hypothetical protein Nepgr_030483 [Nepenthes gracilis]|uniref:Leucine-rich repeat-containing N-terminal plant-type domain-containing protein n=1 Tax=Nepenthes gracilis TaxID=150966 RepID=A0AAD3TEQ1_NEPGR|nr:hypothetical protein Nepgr_030483 [Nepenthes gracilis]
MVSLLQLSLCLLCLSLHSPLTTSSPYPNSSAQLCHEDERFAMLEFKNNLAINDSGSIARICARIGQVPYVKTASWKATGSDCCQWDGVTCNPLTGHVVGLDLSCGKLQGTIPMNSTLFTLHHLRSLNLAFNDFYPSRISPEFGRFLRLKRLNLSHCFFTGKVPLTIAQLPQLASLDLSQFAEVEFDFVELEIPDFMELEMPDFNVIVRNLTGLRELYVNYVFLNSTASTFSSLTHLSSLMTLSLKDCGIFGPLPVWIWNITREIYLSANWFTGKLPSMVDISKLSQLTLLDLSNNFLDGEVPSWLFSLSSLKVLSLGINQFSGQLTISEDVASSSSLMNRSSLMSLFLSNCNFSGPLPTWIWNITQDISLSNNQFTGKLPSMVDRSKLSQLTSLDLSKNLLDGKVPSWLFSLPSLEELYLANNQFFGQLTVIEDGASNNTTLLKYIDLGGNMIQGSIPNSIFELVSLVVLDLSSNNLSGIIELDMFCKLKNLTHLDLSYNGLSVLTKSSSTISSNVAVCPRLQKLMCSSCNITDFPDFLRAQENLTYLDLSNNKIQGDIPKWAKDIGKDSLSYLNLSSNFLTGRLDLQWTNLQYIDLHSNMFEGPAPIPPPFTCVLLASNNNFAGEIPSAICTLDSLQTLDLSYNSLSGEIPPCFKIVNNLLSVLDLRSNKLHGTLPSIFGEYCSLQTLALNGNQLEGQLPPSLLSCQRLEVLDVGNNNFKGMFPYWLGSLPELKVLILRSNSFHGNVGTSKGKYLFSKLQIFDISNNSFNSTLPSSFLRCFKAMMNSVTLNVKGHDLKFVRILTIITTIDVSNNKLKGEIPEVIGDLVSLRWLNLSQNNFSGCIPPSLASLSVLESLDLSSNKLVGQIPEELAKLTSLEVFNVSQNRLVGPIPQGQQFATFENNSYLGNPKLCGKPLSKKCGDDEASSQPPPRMVQDGSDSEYKGTFGWTIVGIGYGCGTTIGLVAGYYIVICFKNLSNWLSVLDLRSNKLHGTLPSSFGKSSSLRTLVFNGNQLGGQLSPSLLSCQGLEALDVGNNNFNGTSKGKHLFSKLRIFDISNNSFNGTLPSSFLQCFKALKNSTENRGKLQYLGESFYEYSIMLKVKGLNLKFVRILTVITTIDVLNNKLKGEIPEVIGDLVSPRWLNLAHNNFIGHIPPSLASLSELESLDLSSNKLVGQIPEELASLKSLEFFNVSQNRLVGPILQGQQFATFENNLYLRNLGLCGNPLSKKCGCDGIVFFF